TGVADDVVLVRRDETARAPDAGLEGAALLEAELILAPLHQLELVHFDAALPDAFHAPHAAVIVQGRTLLRAPRHGDDGISARIVTVDEPARVVIRTGFHHPRGE